MTTEQLFGDCFSVVAIDVAVVNWLKKVALGSNGKPVRVELNITPKKQILALGETEGSDREKDVWVPEMGLPELSFKFALTQGNEEARTRLSSTPRPQSRSRFPREATVTGCCLSTSCNYLQTNAPLREFRASIICAPSNNVDSIEPDKISPETFSEMTGNKNLDLKQ